eukprot:5519518-Amphidinium_carterae.3
MTAKKLQHLYHEKEVKVIACLKTMVKVELMEGLSKGEIKRVPFGSLRRKADESSQTRPSESSAPAGSDVAKRMKQEEPNAPKASDATASLFGDLSGMDA